MLPDEDSEHDDDEHHQQNDTSDRHGVLLVFLSLAQLVVPLNDLLHRHLHVVVDAIQNCALRQRMVDEEEGEGEGGRGEGREGWRREVKAGGV